MNQFSTSSTFRKKPMRHVLIVSVFLAAQVYGQVPSFKDVVGHDFGERITVHHQMVRYLERLAQTSNRVRIVDQGFSWERRNLTFAIVTSPENHARLQDIQRNAQRLDDPRSLSPVEVTAIAETQPVVVWMGGSIHGFELSGSEAVLKIIERLTTSDDDEVMNVLKNCVVLLDPMLNPDGRDAFANINHENIGREALADLEDWSNAFTGWQALKFRTGHYYFDTNRDWFAHTQRETQGRVPTIRAWRPQVGVDLHEMGSDVEFYFDPPGEPYGPYFPDFAKRWFVRFGTAHARAFDAAGFEYFARERYNFFYPGYTTSSLSYQGAVGMLYEQGSSRGLALKRPDESVRTLRDALMQQFTAGWATLMLSARERRSLLREYYESNRSAIEEGQRGVRRYIITNEGDPILVRELVSLLMRNGIEVHRLTRDAQIGSVRDRTGRTVGQRLFPVGTYVIEASQPRSRLLRALLEPDVPLPADFLKKAREYVERAENPRFYDITAWSLPLLFNVGGYSSSDSRQLSAERVSDQSLSAPSLGQERATYAYLIDGRQTASLAALYHLKAREYRAHVIWEPIVIEGKQFASGTVIVRVGQNDEAIHNAIREVATRFQLEVTPVQTGLSEPPHRTLGSGDVTFVVKTPHVAMLAEDPVQAYSFGWAWYTLDQQYQIPVTILRSSLLTNTRLDRFNVIILPEIGDSAALARIIGQPGLERIGRWVRDGGTLVTIGTGTEVARKNLNLIKLRSWYELKENEKKQRFSVPGAIMRVAVDTARWLSAGYERELPVLVNSDRIFLPPDEPPSAGRRVVARYASKDALRISGHAWQETLDRLPEAVYVYEERVGQGRVIAFAEEVNFRAYFRGANRLFLNAVILGPSAP
jgi:hypothetical protein